MNLDDFDLFLVEREKEKVFLMRCKRMNGSAMIGAFYRLPSVVSGPIEYCHVALDLVTNSWTNGPIRN
jgi:hypothetical protein